MAARLGHDDGTAAMGLFDRNKPATVVGPKTAFRGVFETEVDNLEVRGRVEGDIISKAEVRVAPGGVLAGNLTAAIVRVAGSVEGHVVAHDRLIVEPTGHLGGDARYGQLEVLRGGVIDGRTRALAPGDPAIAAGPVPVAQLGAAPTVEVPPATPAFPDATPSSPPTEASAGVAPVAAEPEEPPAEPPVGASPVEAPLVAADDEDDDEDHKATQERPIPAAVSAATPAPPRALPGVAKPKGNDTTPSLPAAMPAPRRPRDAAPSISNEKSGGTLAPSPTLRPPGVGDTPAPPSLSPGRVPGGISHTRPKGTTAVSSKSKSTAQKKREKRQGTLAGFQVDGETEDLLSSGAQSVRLPSTRGTSADARRPSTPPAPEDGGPMHDVDDSDADATIRAVAKKKPAKKRKTGRGFASVPSRGSSVKRPGGAPRPRPPVRKKKK